MNKLLFVFLISVLITSGCVQNNMITIDVYAPDTPPCNQRDIIDSSVDDAIIVGLEDSDYIEGLQNDGLTLQRFRGPANFCSIPDNYVHLNFISNEDNIYTSLAVQTRCDPTTLTCNFNSEDLFAQLDYLESMNFIGSYGYEKREIHWLFGHKDRVRYYRDMSESQYVLDIYLVDNKVVTAVEYVKERPNNSPIDRCFDGSLNCN